MKLWYFSPYAGGPGIGAAMRAYTLAKLWGEMGHDCTIFPARFHHHLTSPPLAPEFTVDGVRYVSLPARPYSGNGKDRLKGNSGLDNLLGGKGKDKLLDEDDDPLATLLA